MKYKYKVLLIDMPEYYHGNCECFAEFTDVEEAFKLKERLDAENTNDDFSYLVEMTKETK